MLNAVRCGGLKYPVLIAVAVLLVPLWGTVFGGSGNTGRPEKHEAGLLMIQMKSRVRALKMPPAVFPHDEHTSSLKSTDCNACHVKKDGRFDFGFKNAAALGYNAETKLYHDECAGCHKKMEAEGKPSGPLISSCRECHREEKVPAPAWRPIDFDRSLHYRHIKFPEIRFEPQRYNTNCGACHHVYDEKLQKTVYKQGEEGSCRYCHKAVKTDDTRSWPNAAHTMCVNCHLEKLKQKREAGPIQCAGCHSRRGQAEIKVLKKVPRLEWKQPDAVLMAPWLDEAVKQKKLPEQLTNAVAFNHKQHEAAVATCRQCHHASMEPCAECHTTKGIQEGDFIPLGAAMHEKTSAISCVGCHENEMWKPECAGCHGRMAEKPFADLQCTRCHSIAPDRLTPLPAGKEARGRIAEAAVERRRPAQQMVPEKKIPEKLKIGIMADKYRPVEFPHRKIVLAIAERIKDSRLADWFHDKPETLCMGCHHNSPPSLTPPKCAGCHKLAESGTAAERPGLKGAYHGQCIGCHIKMGIQKPSATDCTGCHKQETRDQKQETSNTETL